MGSEMCIRDSNSSTSSCFQSHLWGEVCQSCEKIGGSLLYYGGPQHSIQNPRWTPYHVFPYVYTPYLVLITSSLVNSTRYASKACCSLAVADTTAGFVRVEIDRPARTLPLFLFSIPLTKKQTSRHTLSIARHLQPSRNPPVMQHTTHRKSIVPPLRCWKPPRREFVLA